MTNLYSDTQRLTEAEKMYKQALEIYQRLSQDNPNAYQQEIDDLERVLKKIKE